ncbi:cobaltochelatase subunit CobN [Arcobacter sp. YIC-464]|uniref:cobaltochelatase subunit CobN n=1 Tax=Arcobacter sp. YIC-464 TaxID=3376631 RepID=UPI003C24DC17
MQKLKVFLVFFFFVFSVLSLNAKEKTIFSIVSDRSVSSLNQGAIHYLKNSNDKIAIRTESQVLNMTQMQLQELVSNANTVLYVAVFGELVERLISLDYKKEQTVLALQGDRRLITLNQDISNANYKNLPSSLLSKKDFKNSYEKALKQKQKEFPSYAWYLQARAYWDNRGVENSLNLFKFLSLNTNDSSTWPKFKELKQIRYFLNSDNSTAFTDVKQLIKKIDFSKDILFILDNDKADNTSWQIHKAINENSNLQTISILSSWGEPSKIAVKSIKDIVHNLKENQSFSIISLHDFVIGAGEGRSEVLKEFEELNVPILKAIKVLDSTALSYKLSSQGLDKNSIHYRISMPELQGIGQSHVVAINDLASKDELTGANIFQLKLLDEQIKNIVNKAKKWMLLTKKNNKDKKIAIIYYNHPPGRHNIGADNLNVPTTLFEMLKSLKKQGYQVGELPASHEDLLDVLQERAVNLPNDKKALKEQSEKIEKLSLQEYKNYFETLPKDIQGEMTKGPLEALHIKIVEFLQKESTNINSLQKQKIYTSLSDYVSKTMDNLHHALDGVRSKSRQRAINLLEQLKVEYKTILENAKENKNYSLKNANDLKNAIINLQIEGIKGWGELPGVVMTWNNELLIPSVKFGNIILAPQPPRGWELNEELLHANLSFPPTHQYLAFYNYLKNKFKADAIVHVGRHSTYEFLPRKSVGLSASDYPSLIIEDIPSIYPYIVDGVGEGIQAKRRGQAIMIDHLTPPLATTKLYDDLLKLRQLIESAEAAVDDNIRKSAIKNLKDSIEKMNLKNEIIASMDEELKVRGIGFDEVDDEFLLHEVGHYLTHLQEEFMPLGLHTFGKDWNNKAIETMLKSMSKEDVLSKETKENLVDSPKAEMNSFINALNGGFVTAGKGNDPIRTNEALPTGRNFYAIDGGLIPSNVGYEVGVKLALKAKQKKKEFLKKEAVILWASDTVRDEGAMIAFGFELLGVKPIWNSRGIVKGLKRLSLDERRQKRYDIIFTGSGLFRDLYGTQLALLHKAVLMALDASYDTILKDYPALTLSLDSALKPLGDLKEGGNESLEVNAVAANFVNELRELLKQNPNANYETLGKQAIQRVFATAPGAYGAGINRLVERSGSWEDRKELAKVFIKRMSYSYSIQDEPQVATQSFIRQLKEVESTYLGRASNLYGLIDNNDTFDYLGGLNLAIESLTNKQPKSYVLNHSNTNDLKIDGLETALLSELRGRFFNPQWIKPLMKEGYAGARTMGSEFIEYLWGWQVTNPEIIKDGVWEEVKAVYVDDKLNLGLDEFLSSNHQVHVQTNILAIMLVAIQKDFWQTSEETKKQLSEKFAQNIIEKGIPGSGHTHSNHPIYEFVKQNISKQQALKLAQKVEASRLEKQEIKKDNYKAVKEIELKQQEQNQKKEVNKSQDENKNSQESYLIYLILGALLVLFAGLFNSLILNRKKGI